MLGSGGRPEDWFVAVIVTAQSLHRSIGIGLQQPAHGILYLGVDIVKQGDTAPPR
jgi:hypothetical protein